MARFIAFDWGKVRTGLAVTDSSAIIASPHSTVKTDVLFAEIKKLINAEPCAGFVVGVPGLFEDLETDSTRGINTFIEKLNKTYPSIEIHRVDESFTSSEAMGALHAGGMKKKKRREKGSLDKVAAAIILQRFLETV